ncbi:MAG: glycosyltransferase [Lachnospiraceae bacterium]|nr:glycosyltransferase [Lachnospiraceae bacterium]
MTFSIIVVCLNAGEKLRSTVESIRRQTEKDYEVIIKDGGSTDEDTKGLLDALEKACETDSRIRVYRREKDNGIYDGMNQAVRYAAGDYIFFLNCGDSFYDDQVLALVREQIVRYRDTDKTIPGDRQRNTPYIFYGNICEQLTGTMVQSNPVLDDFACYRNLPCHQACFYAASLLKMRKFDTQYRVRADYEHFLWCCYRGGARAVYMPVTVAFYEGGGFSETKASRKASKEEHREIVAKYLPPARVFGYRIIMFLTLAPLRTWIAGNPALAGLYQSVKRKVYRC